MKLEVIATDSHISASLTVNRALVRFVLLLVARLFL